MGWGNNVFLKPVIQIEGVFYGVIFGHLSEALLTQIKNCRKLLGFGRLSSSLSS